MFVKFRYTGKIIREKVFPQDTIEDLKNRLATRFNLSPSTMTMHHPFPPIDFQDKDKLLKYPDFRVINNFTTIIIKEKKQATPRYFELYQPDSCLTPCESERADAIEILHSMFPDTPENTLNYALESALFNIDLAIEYILDDKIPSSKTIAENVKTIENHKKESYYSSAAYKVNESLSPDFKIIDQLINETNQSRSYVTQMYSFIREDLCNMNPKIQVDEIKKEVLFALKQDSLISF